MPGQSANKPGSGTATATHKGPVKVFRNPREARIDYLSSRLTNSRMAADANSAKWVAMNRDGIGTEINRGNYKVPLPPHVNVDTGRKNSQRGHKGSS